MRRLPSLMLTLAGLASIALGVMAMRLPYAHHIAPGAEGVAPTIRWAWYAHNAFLGFLLVLDGALLAALALRGRAGTSPGVWVVIGSGAFWALVSLYSFSCLVPEPPDMPLLRDTFQAAALSMLLLHAVPLAIFAAGRASGPGAGA